jgi:hypothetical protein
VGGDSVTSAAKAAFARAVVRERQAIERHEAAAQQQYEIAVDLWRQAADEADEVWCRKVRKRAADAHARADAAMERAARARQRLRDEGLDPDQLRPATPARHPASMPAT